ncbi:hypothetical protein [Aneurinibacillus sp. Ricciae_BoGa-3]|uniref:hypothetical protein n=1 Tax=Aneurinibacillus sp. Ricciae_BoGa-3 TaxID=3022697 RepID=UPI002FEE0142
MIDLQEATGALQAMLDKYVPGYFSSALAQGHVEKYRSGMGSPVCVYCIQPERVTAKEDKGVKDMMYYAGRRQEDDIRKARAKEG